MKTLYPSALRQKMTWLLASLFCVFIVGVFLFVKHVNTAPWWKFETQALITGHKAYSIPTRVPISIDQRHVYVNDYHGHVYALNMSTGKPIWTFTTNNYSPYPVTVTDGQNVYIADFDGRIYALDKKRGHEIWRFTIPDLIQPDTPAYATSKHVIFGARNGVLYALDKKTGAVDWQFRVGSPPLSEIKIGQKIIHFGMITATSDIIVVNSPYKFIFVLKDSDGSLIKKIPLSSYTQEAPVKTREEILAYDGDKKITAIDVSTGFTKWEKILPFTISSTLKASSSSAYFIDSTDTAYIVDTKNGTTRTQFPLAQSNSCHVYTQGSSVSNIVYDHFIVASGSQLCSFSSQSGKFHWQISVGGNIKTITQAGNGSVLIVSEKESRSILTVVSLYNGKVIDWADNIDIHTQSFLASNNIWYFISRNERKIFSIRPDNDSPFKLLEILKLCCRLGFPVLTPDLSLWEQVPITIKSSWWARLHGFIKTLFDNSIVIHTNTQNNITPNVYELTFTRDDQFISNPFTDTKLTVTFFDKKKNSVKIQGFYEDKKTWKARFSPPHPGTWRWVARMRIGMRTFTRHGTLPNSIPDKKEGYIEKKDNFSFLSLNSAPFIGIGLQDTMRDDNFDGNPINQWGSIENKPLESNVIKYTDIDTYFRTYRDKGSGFILYRFGVDNASFRLWKTINPSGNRYGINEGIWTDRVFLALKINNYRIMMSIFGFEPPITDVDNKAKRLALNQYLDYVVGRFSAYVDIWELLNESTVSDKWIQYVSTYIRSIDPYHHPITTNWQRPQLSEIDINSIHWYDDDSSQTIDVTTKKLIHDASLWKKPIMISEQGNKNISWSPDSALRLRVKLWVSSLSGTSIIFWNQVRGQYKNPDNANIYLGSTEIQYVSSLHKIIGDAIQDGKMESIATSNPLIHIYKQNNSASILIYIYNAENSGRKISTTFRLENPISGNATWYNPSDGAQIGSMKLNKGTHEFVTPAFTQDIILKIE